MHSIMPLSSFSGPVWRHEWNFLVVLIKEKDFYQEGTNLMFK